MSIFPYPREFSHLIPIDNSYALTQERYKSNNTSSSTDNSIYAPETNNINGWYRNAQYSSILDPEYRGIFSKEMVRNISDQVTMRLRGVHPEGKDIMVPDNMILSLIDTYWNYNHRDADVIKQQVILHIIDSIKTEFETTDKNNKLSVWVTNYTPDTGLKRFNGIKLNEKSRPQFWIWNY